MKFHKFVPLLVIVLLTRSVLSAPPPDQGVRRVTYEELPRLVEERNENVSAANLNVTSYKERLGRLRRSFLPQVSAQVGEEEFRADRDLVGQQRYWRILTSLNLYHGGRDSIENDIRKSQLTIAQTERAGDFQRELMEARKTFWEALAIAMLIAEKKEAVEKNELLLKSARRRAGAGITTTADAVQLEIYKISLQRGLKSLEHEHDVELNRLSVAIALDEHKHLELVGSFPDITTARLKDVAPDRQLNVRTSREMQKIENHRASQSSRWWLPKLDLYASYGLPSLTDDVIRALRNDREWTAGLKLSLDLGQGFEERREAAARQAQAASLERRAAHATREAVATDHELRHEMGILAELISNADADTERASKFLKLTESEYARGVKNGPDLLEAFQQLYEIREKRIENYREYLKNKSELENLIAGAEYEDGDR